MNEIERLKDEIRTRKMCTMDEHMGFYNQEAESDYKLFDRIEKVLGSLFANPVSEDLREVCLGIFKKNINEGLCFYDYHEGFVDGVNWQKNKLLVDSIDAEVGQGKHLTIPTLNYMIDKMELTPGDKVKLVITKIKEL